MYICIFGKPQLYLKKNMLNIIMNGFCKQSQVFGPLLGLPHCMQFSQR